MGIVIVEFIFKLYRQIEEYGNKDHDEYLICITLSTEIELLDEGLHRSCSTVSGEERGLWNHTASADVPIPLLGVTLPFFFEIVILTVVVFFNEI